MRLNLVLVAVAASSLVGAGAALGADVAYPPGYWFSDDGSVHEGNIEAIAEASITVGCGEGLYCPADELTRGQFASLLARTLGLPAAAGDFFDDDDGTVHEGASNRLAAAGIAAGCAPRRFCPGDSLTRGQLAALLVRALPDLEKPAVWNHFTDDDVPGPHRRGPHRGRLREGTARAGLPPRLRRQPPLLRLLQRPGRPQPGVRVPGRPR